MDLVLILSDGQYTFMVLKIEIWRTPFFPWIRQAKMCLFFGRLSEIIFLETIDWDSK
jgi:hypothetical protein